MQVHYQSYISPVVFYCEDVFETDAGRVTLELIHSQTGARITSQPPRSRRAC
jgi:hypothetical protein